MDIGLPELFIILMITLLLCSPSLLLVATVLLGPGRIARAAGGLGRIIGAFRDGLQGKEDRPDPP
jgi:Sec-independent protein translocase protein TatA